VQPRLGCRALSPPPAVPLQTLAHGTQALVRRDPRWRVGGGRVGGVARVDGAGRAHFEAQSTVEGAARDAVERDPERGLKLSWDRKQAQREKRKALMAVVRAARDEDEAAKDAERKRRYEKRKRKEENELRSAKKVVISNPKKLAKMSKKQFLTHVHKNKGKK
jgi:hypothetical protein